MNIAVTGAFGYSGKYIASRLLDRGHAVTTLTQSPQRRNPFGERIRVCPLAFDEPELLRRSLAGVEALINTYWVRFNHRLFTHSAAVSNTRVLFEAAKAAGVRRIVHVSITHPDPDSPLPYFRGKAQLERALEGLGLSYCILRPAVLFGREDVLINNIAWALRHFPVYGLFGKGDYRLQPIYVEDFADLAVEAALGKTDGVINAIGPETFTYRELVQCVRESIGSKCPVVSMPPWLAYWGCWVAGLLTGDVVITRQEIQGLMEGRLSVSAEPTGKTRLSDWLKANYESVGKTYASELKRRMDRRAPYVTR